MKKKNVQLGKKLTLSKATIASLSNDQQMRIEGGATHLCTNLCATLFEPTCHMTVCQSQSVQCPSANWDTSPCKCV